jgi:putative hydroxymethylpyrimidine transport system substrate-binding protein
VRRTLFALLLAAAALGGCGGDSGGAGAPKRITVALDFTPNAAHAPIYAAARKGFDREHGVRIRIRPPGSAPDSLKLLTAGRADVGVLDIHDLGLARERGADLVGIAGLVQRPLAAIIARDYVHRPRELEGRRVGVSGLPSDIAVLRAVVEGDGGDFSKVRRVTIGFAAVPSLIERKVDAVPAFWNAEGVVLRKRRVPIREFRVDDYGAPRYPEVVLLTRRANVGRDEIKGTVEAIREGVENVLADPEPAIREIARAGGADEGLTRAQMTALRPVLRPPLRLDRRALREWAAFDVRFGILKRRPRIDEAFELGLANP